MHLSYGPSMHLDVHKTATVTKPGDTEGASRGPRPGGGRGHLPGESRGTERGSHNPAWRLGVSAVH